MTKCEHSFWLELSHEMAVPQVVYGSRLARLVNELPQPSVQLPQVVFFMGHHQKNKALRQLCSSNYRGQGRNAPSVNIRSDNRTLQSLQPRFFADCDPCRSLLSTHESLRNCHEEKIYPVELRSTEYSLQDIIIARLVFLFTDVVCIFADDVGGFEGTRKLLTTWAAIGSASSLPPAVRPRVIVVVSQSPSITGGVIDENDFLFELLHAGDVPYFSAFRDIQVSSLPAEELSSDARYMTLGSDVSRQLRSSRVDRERYRSLFSAIHLSAFFELALHNLSASPFAPFDFIRSARNRNPLDGAFASHITSFLKVGSKTRTPYNEMASHIASAILMDAYPPGMHYFLPSMVYRTLYHDPCYTGLRKFYSTDALASVQSERVQHHLSRFFEHMASNLGPSSEIHKNNLKQQRKFWAWAKSNKTCLLCLRRHPEHPQACGHGICDTCAEIFGEPSLHTEHEYTICQCILCGNAKGLTVRLKPPTAAPRLLSIDGGGLRGIIPPSNLELLQNDIGPELPLADLIDLRVGTSSGGLYVIAMDILRMGPSEFKRVFQGLAKKVLGPDQRKGRIMSLLSDATYDTKALENQYKDVFGPTRRLFDAPATLLSAGKMAVTTTSIKDGSLFLFTNYNGAAPHRAESVYGRLRPDEDYGPYIWQIALATSAAPPLFSTVNIPGLGTFQDGGMGRDNNPINIALFEAKHLWPSVTNPDVVITLGTGTETSSPKTSFFRNVLLDGWIPRVYRSYMRSFDGGTTWKELKMRLDNKSQETYYRFDQYLPEGLPAMDDPDCVAGLSKQVQTQSGEDHSGVVVALLTACLFFQLDKMPVYKNGLYHCVGTIRCRAPPRPLIERLAMIPGRQAFYKGKLNLGLSLSADDICFSCHRYSLPVRFFVRDLEESITLSLRIGEAPRRLSAFPNCMQWFIEEQKLDCVFGSPNHDIPLQIINQGFIFEAKTLHLT
ncbi:patatin-like phospholipase family protein [Aspergillus melleus]|uniref:patatin-like phospholipase family protein n=1 Tax=Aspergillus melleus TaxID=138277 RepID=UPI001E8D553F|nr:uncharacterized protein LDX57_001971 [Aspergillus melleus]KAH8424214.1 hypothetical protein LDX57_001971 [Aspergillus melleus]